MEYQPARSSRVPTPDDGMIQVKIVIRCFVERVADSQWQAFSLEYGLAAQAETQASAQSKLSSMIVDYIREAMTDDKMHAKDLLTRQATWSVYFKYYMFWTLSKVRNLIQNDVKASTYRAPVPMLPAPV